MTTTTTEHVELAQQWRGEFEQITRNDGSTPWVRKNIGAEDALFDACHTAHGGSMPDDWIYRFIVESLDLMSENDDWEGLAENIEPDVYYSQLFAWLADGGVEYCDRAIEDGWTFDSTVALLQMGQLIQKREVSSQSASPLRTRSTASSQPASGRTGGEVMTCANCGKAIESGQQHRRVKGTTPAWQHAWVTIHKTCPKEASQ